MITPKQEEVYQNIRNLLSEHFDNYCLIVECEINDPESGQIATFWKGSYQGHSAAVGLMEKQKSEMLRKFEEL